VAKRRNSEFHISWMFISYRRLALALLALILIAGTVAYLLMPVSMVQSLTNYANKLLGKIVLNTPGKLNPIGPQQAHFTALDGTVRVKKASSNSWVTADFSLPLEKGDVVQTSSEGMAKVFFADGTSYTVKPDSLIVVEENSANEQQQTQVSVQVTTGTVDLSTATYAQGSSSHVIVAGATAALAPESAAMVQNDPRADRHEILLKKGSGQVTRKSETVALSEYEKVSFSNNSTKMSRTKEVGPPTLIAPSNMMAVYVPAAGKPVHFSWTPTASSHGYRLRVSRNPYFSSTLFDKVVAATETDVASLKEGAYYWVVTSQDENGHESVESERNQFTIVLRAPETVALPLELEPFVQHGHVIEIKGRTDPGARVMVNGQEVPVIRSDGNFSYFTPPLPNGENVITVTAQNAKGGVKTQQKKVVID
jgi:glucodextranase-like protein